VEWGRGKKEQPQPSALLTIPRHLCGEREREREKERERERERKREREREKERERELQVAPILRMGN
jgi:hypothetical protein